MLLTRRFHRIRSLSTFSGLTSEEFLKKKVNEPILEYKKGSRERKALEQELSHYSKNVTEVPLRIGNKKITNNLERKQVMPSDHKSTLARFTHATKEQITEAIDVALQARVSWEKKSLKDRAEILLKAADLCAGKYRMSLNATTMLGQGKNIIQAEIDAACELIDFFRFNAVFAMDLEKYEPISTKLSKNTLHFRGMEGFVAAIAPFNFTAIGGNLPTAPALMGNVSLWKPSDTAVLSNYIIYQILEEAGMPPGVLSFLPSHGPDFGDAVTSSPHLSAINFTGSVPTFKHLWRRVADNLDRYVTFPKLIGECGGKNFHFIHPSAHLDSVATGTIRSAFEYSGQKCSACSRMYVPKSIWETLLKKLSEIHSQLKVGDVRDGSVFMSAVIDDKSFDRVKKYIDYAKTGADGAKIRLGGTYDDSKGYFVQPTIITVTNPKSKLLTEEIFGPVLTVYVYNDADVDKVLESVKDATPFGLTGAVFSQDKDFLYKARDVLRDAVGNMYLNDKSTGSIVGQQPFGGARLSGTNDKAGGPHYGIRWTSPLTIKETSVPLSDWRYPETVMGCGQITDWTDVSFEFGRTALRSWRETGVRRSEEAVELWEHVISRSPLTLGDERWPVYEQICVAALDCARVDLAQSCIEALETRFPNSKRVQKLHAMRHEATDQYPAAVDIYDQLIEADPTNNGFRKRKIAALLGQGKRLSAIKELNEYLKIFLNDVEAWLKLSELFLQENDLSKAAHCLEECVLVSPLNSMYLRRLADIRYTQGGQENIELARAYYERAVKLHPNDMRSLYGITLCSNQLASLLKTASEKKKSAQTASNSLNSIINRYSKVKNDENPEADSLVKTLQTLKNNFSK
ncbi:unnamed protein product [Caenorhabditis auriculariae]|uniref:Delta-1-pyrroline-5-carboxylate dehydrogenase, mitochondrial n=1 Tax=Caenorhabditis auriculariae TaxID=2777116 RepID=A0A8S1HL41_9PELO|nr:unnamed protein product [Caenorhabditis auriculariae]